MENAIEGVGIMLEKGMITLTEAENQIDRAVLAACEPLETDGEAWLKKFYELKRKGWKTLLKATEKLMK